VQDPQYEVDFFDRVYRSRNRRAPRRFLEHFSGTALAATEWVARGRERSATAIDLDPRVLAWGKKHNASRLENGGVSRLRLLCRDVRAPHRESYDVACALNFSYWVFKTRSEMLAYFAHARTLLARGGVFVIDAYGGWESQKPLKERRRIRGGYTYVWEQGELDPITHDVTNYIHFERRGKSVYTRAFRYDWRYWSLPELRELLAEAGFSEIRVYWDFAKRDKDPNEYRPATRSENQPGWLVYLVAYR